MLAAILLIWTAGACWADEATILTFRGEEYRGMAPESFNIDRGILREVGRVERTNDPASDGTVYRLPGVDSSLVVVLVHRDGSLVLFVWEAIFAALPTPVGEGVGPLARAIPELCPYWKETPPECGGEPTLKPTPAPPRPST